MCEQYVTLDDAKPSSVPLAARSIEVGKITALNH